MNGQTHARDRQQPTRGKPLVGFRKCQFRIHAEEGIAIHGGDTGLEIGSVVEPNLRVIRNAATGYPYVPGSSLKGKLRSTLEVIKGLYDSRGKPHSCGRADCVVCVIFGAGNPGEGSLWSAPTRIVVRDAQLTADWQQEWKKMETENKPTLELKTESSSNRATGAAVNPRTGERVPPGTEFQGEIILREFKDDHSQDYIKAIQDLMKFVEEADGIGSGVSRGSGKVTFRDFRCETHQAPQFP